MSLRDSMKRSGQIPSSAGDMNLSPTSPKKRKTRNGDDPDASIDDCENLKEVPTANDVLVDLVQRSSEHEASVANNEEQPFSVFLSDMHSNISDENGNNSEASSCFQLMGDLAFSREELNLPVPKFFDQSSSVCPREKQDSFAGVITSTSRSTASPPKSPPKSPPLSFDASDLLKGIPEVLLKLDNESDNESITDTDSSNTKRDTEMLARAAERVKRAPPACTTTSTMPDVPDTASSDTVKDRERFMLQNDDELFDGDFAMECPKCNHHFQMFSSLKFHVKYCGRELRLQCKYCPIWSCHITTLKRHLRRNHSNDMESGEFQEVVDEILINGMTLRKDFYIEEF